MEEGNQSLQPSTSHNFSDVKDHNSSDVKPAEGRINQDFDKEESVDIVINEDEIPPEPSSSNNHKFSDVKPNDHEKVQDFGKEESTSTLIEDEVTQQPSNANHLQTNRKKRRRRRLDKPKLTHSEARNLAVIIRRADGALVTRELATIIRKRLCDCILEACRKNVDSRKLNFYNSGLVDAGYFLVTAVNEQSRDWLMSCKIGFYEGVALKMFRRGKEKKKVPKSSGSAINNQNICKETSTSAPIKEQESLSEPSSSCMEINNEDFNTEESIKTINKEVKDSLNLSGNTESITNEDFAAEKSRIKYDVKKDNN